MATPEADISVSCSTEYKDYSYNAQHDIWTLVSLKAPSHEEKEDDKRAPIDIVAVLDKSGSMSGEKLKLVKRTMEFVLTQCMYIVTTCIFLFTYPFLHINLIFRSLFIKLFHSIPH